MTLTIEPLTDAHQAAVLAIYAEGIAGGLATFETTVPPWSAWDANHLPAGRLVARRDDQVIGWAALSRVSARAVYGGVAEESVYIAAAARGQGVGRALLLALIEVSEAAGFWMLQGSIFRHNVASLALHERCGFRVVGYRERIAQRDGIWHDTILVERRSAR
ncbi:MAG: N-acetyltransferase family protein [Anaerolineae bacterium]|jgi:phosphinothricin acetyltransferase|nr:N-acetyltransferase family protein [Anaerolineae bacterium]